MIFLNTTRAGFMAAVVCLAAIVAACGGSSTSPSSTAPRISSISPTAASTAGGAVITITGVNFSPSATVTIGGVAAGSVTVSSATTITAAAPAHSAGAADVAVTSNGQTASLPGGLVYVANTAPLISSIVAKGAKPREPAQFADLDEAVSVTATVTDTETPTSQLTFAWSADTGTFNGTGLSVTWTAPHAFATPATVTLTLTVTEAFQTTGPAGSASGQNKTVGTTALRLHDSAKEVGDLAVDFLTAFSKQLDLNFIMRNFTASCRGTADETNDVIRNQHDFTITAYQLGAPATQASFTGTCPFPAPRPPIVGDACANVPAEWHSLVKSNPNDPALVGHEGQTMNVTGTDVVSAVLENDQWKLCSSNWAQTSATFTSHDHPQPVPTTARFKR